MRDIHDRISFEDFKPISAYVPDPCEESIEVCHFQNHQYHATVRELIQRIVYNPGLITDQHEIAQLHRPDGYAPIVD